MYVAPLPALSCSQSIMDSRDVVTISRFALEALLRAAVPGYSADDLDVASHVGRYSDMTPIASYQMWRDELVDLVRYETDVGHEAGASGLDIQWFDDVAQAIDFGAISEAPLSLANRPC
jgi:hypothetical protein